MARWMKRRIHRARARCRRDNRFVVSQASLAPLAVRGKLAHGWRVDESVNQPVQTLRDKTSGPEKALD
ncbi:MAG TPA: hypothetical protein VGB17_18975 [Pyrinomonadaceae bacterium]